MYKVTTYLNENRFPYLVKEECHYGEDKDAQYNEPERIWELCKAMRMNERATEMVLLLVFNSANHIICISELSTGSMDRSIMSVREVARTVLLAGGISCVLAHNHPSGDTTPSDTDITITHKLIRGLRELDIEILDHIIVGRNEYTSLRKRGII